MRSINEISKLKQQIPNKFQSAISKFQTSHWALLVIGSWNLKFICDLGFDIRLLRFPQIAKFLPND
jgi:hypothetical protein